MRVQSGLESRGLVCTFAVRTAATRQQAAARAKLVREFCRSFIPVDIDRAFAGRRVAGARSHLDYVRRWDPGATSASSATSVALDSPSLQGALLESVTPPASPLPGAASKGGYGLGDI